ncbi:hypothetical protein FUT63_11480 [Extensimonas vulgaris]|nr:hypothetical protein FUT63_11480 [Extensimonas vulgaris]
MQILAIPPGIAAVCALPRPKIHRFYLSHQASNTTLVERQPRCMGLLWFQRNPLSMDWVAQRQLLVGFDA